MSQTRATDIDDGRFSDEWINEPDKGLPIEMNRLDYQQFLQAQREGTPWDRREIVHRIVQHMRFTSEGVMEEEQETAYLEALGLPLEEMEAIDREVRARLPVVTYGKRVE